MFPSSSSLRNWLYGTSVQRMTRGRKISCWNSYTPTTAITIYSAENWTCLRLFMSILPSPSSRRSLSYARYRLYSSTDPPLIKSTTLLPATCLEDCFAAGSAPRSDRTHPPPDTDLLPEPTILVSAPSLRYTRLTWHQLGQ